MNEIIQIKIPLFYFLNFSYLCYKLNDMTKKELIELLSQYDDDMLILIPGYESGYDLTGYVTSSHALKMSVDWWDGEYHVSNDAKLTPNAILLHPKER